MTEADSIAPCPVRENADLAGLTTFGVPAAARWLAEPSSLDELKSVLSDPRFAGLPRLVLGGGSNILFTKDFDGLVIRLRMSGIRLVAEDGESRTVEIEAGAPWTETVAELLSRGWSGLENLSLIPGTVGGAAVQNVGAYGVEAAEFISAVTCLDPDTMDTVRLSAEECDYGYRTSVFKRPEKQGLIVISVEFRLPRAFRCVTGYKELEAYFRDRKPGTAQELADAVISIRRRKLPDPKVTGSAGSFFKNPVVNRVKMVSLLTDYPRLVAYPLAGGRSKFAAGWLIDAAGMKSASCGGAGLWPQHALILVNNGGATGADVLCLARKIQKAVFMQFGIELEPEVVII